MMVKLFLICVMLSVACGCSQKSAVSSYLSFNPDEAKNYQLTVTTISSTRSAFAIYGDTLLWRIDLQLLEKDSTVNKMLMVIRELKLSLVPFKQVDSNLAAQYANLPMNAYRAKRDSVFKSVSGDSLVVFINDKGELLMEDGLDRLIKNVSRKATVDSSQVRGMLEDFLSPAATKDLLARIFFYLPARDVKEKDSWVNNVILSSMAPVKHSHLMVLNKVDEQQYYTDISAQISAGGTGTQYLRGKTTGSLRADRSSGFPLSMTLKESTVTQTISGDLTGARTFTVSCTIGE